MALRIGVVGGGQLARMMIAPAVELGVELRVLAEDSGMSASLAATAVVTFVRRPLPSRNTAP